MSPKLRAFVGAITTALFLIIGLGFLSEQRYGVGGVLFALGLFRGWALVGDIRRARSDD